MKRILFVCTRPPGSRFRNGGTSLTEANHKALSSFADLECFSTLPEQESRLASLWRRCAYYAGRFGGFSPARFAELVARVEAFRPEAVFFDHSQLAAFAAGLARRFPGLPLYVQFHNYEANYVPMGRLPLQGRLRALLQANDRRALLSARAVTLVLAEDRDCLLHGVEAPPPCELIPVTVPKELYTARAPRQDHYLYFGANSPRNREALFYLIKQILPSLPAPLWVAGTGMEYLVLPSSERLVLKGSLDAYEECLATSIALLCPAFSGSGMNVKLADALRCGLPVLTNRFGARGFPSPYPEGFVVEEEPAAFVRAAAALRERAPASAPMQAYFKKHVSVQARQEGLQRLLAY